MKPYESNGSNLDCLKRSFAESVANCPSMSEALRARFRARSRSDIPPVTDGSNLGCLKRSFAESVANARRWHKGEV